MAKRKLTRTERQAATFAKCAAAIDAMNRQTQQNVYVADQDTKRVMAMLAAVYLPGRQRLVLKVEED